jgi:LacI family transcriptional regulator
LKRFILSFQNGSNPLPIFRQQKRSMPTISDVAKRAGVSVGTVSNVINNAERVSPATRAKVERAIQEMGYVPSLPARSLRSRRTRWLALVVPDIANAYWHAAARGVEDAAQSRGYAVLLGNADDNLTKQRQYLDVAISQSVAGLIIAPCDADPTKLAGVRNQGIPLVTINRRIEGWDVDAVYSDSISGARALMRHLVELGHRRIAMISGPRHLTTVQDRIAGYCIAMSEAGIPLEARFIKSGQFQAASGEHLTEQVLDESLSPSAIFAANNTIALGVMRALSRRGLRIPQDIALVCFGDFAEVYYPFMTVILEPAYEMGMNAAQLLFSRLDAEEDLEPRQVVLPTRLIIRQSCGANLKEDGKTGPCLVIPQDLPSSSRLVKPLSPEEQLRFADCIAKVIGPPFTHKARPSNVTRPDVTRLLQVLQHRPADRLPHLEFQITGRALYEHVLGRDLAHYAPGNQVDAPPVTPEDHIEFAQHLGMDAVVCNFSWRPGCRFQEAADGTRQYIDGTVRSWADLDHLSPPPSLADQLSRLERYLLSAQGTGVGVAASFSSFYQGAIMAIGPSLVPDVLRSDPRFLDELMNVLLDHQEKVTRAVCDRFGEELSFVVIEDTIAGDEGPGITLDLFQRLFSGRMRRQITPAKEHAKLVVFSGGNEAEAILPILVDIGFDAVYPVQPGADHILHLKHEWDGHIALLGGFPTQLLIEGSPEAIEARVREYNDRLSPGGGYVLSCTTPITAQVPLQNFVAMIRAVHHQASGSHWS